MKTICCACGKVIRMSSLLGNEGHELQGKAYACYDCCNFIGYGKGFFGAMGTAFITREEFVQRYNDAIEQEKLKKEEELAAKRKIKEDRQAKIESAKKIIANIKNIVDPTLNNDTPVDKNDHIAIEELSNEDIQSKMQSFIVENPGIILKDGEKCFYQGACYSARLKNVVTGTKSNTVQIGGKNALGMYTGVGNSQRKYDRNTVSEKYPGNFYITDKRMICSAPKFAFEIKLTDITSLSAYEDAFIITVKDKTYIVETKDIDAIKDIIATSNEGIKRGLTENITKESADNSKKTSEDKIIELLREYKNLYNEGIITEEEFINKKKQLLQK